MSEFEEIVRQHLAAVWEGLSGAAPANPSVTTRISVEESTRASGDTSLTSRISTDESAGLVHNTSLDTRLSSNDSAGMSIYNSNIARFSTNDSTGASVTTSLTTRISTEESIRGSSDTSLMTRLSGDESSGASANASLATAISAVGGGGGGVGSIVKVVEVTMPNTGADYQNNLATFTEVFSGSITIGGSGSNKIRARAVVAGFTNSTTHGATIELFLNDGSVSLVKRPMAAAANADSSTAVSVPIEAMTAALAAGTYLIKVRAACLLSSSYNLLIRPQNDGAERCGGTMYLEEIQG